MSEIFPNGFRDLVTVGLAANRPTTPAIPPDNGGIALFYAADTKVLSCYTTLAGAWFNCASVEPSGTFANLPANPVLGQCFVVTDAASAYAKGATVAAGGGANIISAFYNGTNWVSC